MANEVRIDFLTQSSGSWPHSSSTSFCASRYEPKSFDTWAPNQRSSINLRHLSYEIVIVVVDLEESSVQCLVKHNAQS